jgi:superfamily II DNA or RNA helicase
MVADYSKVSTVGGDYNLAEAAAVMSRPDVTGDCVKHYLKLSQGLPAVVFCVNIEHSELVAANFQSAGVPAAVIHSKLSSEDRRNAVLHLGSGEIHVLTSCDIVNEGFDLPVVTTAILMRKTQSLGLHLQQIGRILRPHPAKAYSIVIDHVGNLLTHGCAEDHREWSLDSKKRKKPKEDATRQCPECYAVYPIGTRVCPECGHADEPAEPKLKTVSDEDLQEFDPRTAKLTGTALRYSMQECRTYDDFKALERRQGYKKGWAHIQLKLWQQNRKSSQPSGH